jgi:hypothetical protein
MGPAFVILFWLLIAGIYVVIFLALAGLCLVSSKKKWRIFKWLTGALASAMIVVAIIVVTLLAWGIIRASNPTYLFKDTFLVAPPASVSEIKSSCYWFADTGSIYLRFKTSEDDFKKLIPAHLQKKSLEDFKNNIPVELDGNLPLWWDFSQEAGWVYYSRTYRINENNLKNIQPGEKGFFNETEYYAFNPKTGIAYYHFIGID